MTLADVEDICDRVVMIQDGVVIYNDIYNKYKKYTFIFDDIIPLNKELQEEVNNGRLLIKDNAITFFGYTRDRRKDYGIWCRGNHVKTR